METGIAVYSNYEEIVRDGVTKYSVLYIVATLLL